MAAVLFRPGVPKTSPAPAGLVQLIALFPPGFIDPAQNKLSHPIANFYEKRLVAAVHKNDPHFPPIIGINGARGIRNEKAVFQSQPAPGPDLKLIPGRDFYKKPCPDKSCFPRRDLFGLGSAHVHPRCMTAHVAG